MKRLLYGWALAAIGSTFAAETNMSCCGVLPSRFGPPQGPEGMVWIPGVEFTIGREVEVYRVEELPLHRVQLDGFWIKQTPVTNAEFKEFVDATGYVICRRKETRAGRNNEKYAARLKTATGIGASGGIDGIYIAGLSGRSE